MIESNIVKWVDLGDTMQNIDIYSRKSLANFFKFFRAMMRFKIFPVFFFILLEIVNFIQIIALNIVLIEEDNDSTVKILKSIDEYIFLHRTIKDKNSFQTAILINSILTLYMIVCLIYLVISIKIHKFYTTVPIFILNFLNLLIIYYLICPIVIIALISTDCPGGNHKYLQVKCFSDWTHTAIFAISFFNLLFYISYIIILSLYYNPIGSINDLRPCARINCNYELFMNSSKILFFILTYILETYTNKEKVYKIILEVYILANCIVMVIYIYESVLFYNAKMNVINQSGWIFICWFSLVNLLKIILSINDTMLFHIIGWIVIGFILYFHNEYRVEYLLTEFNIFEATTLKEIEMFNLTLMSLINKRSTKSRTLLVGILRKFEDILKTNADLQEKYNKLCSNEHLMNKFNGKLTLPVYSIIYVVYSHHIEKSQIKNDILLNLCYFLMNKYENPAYVVHLCSKFKATEHKHLYFKFILMEELREEMIIQITKTNNKESIKNVEIGSVILYDIYMNQFKIKIFDAACNQIDYFGILKNPVTTQKTTEHFLKIGEDILNLRKDILNLWEKIVDLNPFSDESEKDYMIYLETILQDDVLARTEAKKYLTAKTNKLSERNNIYYSMFVKEYSSVILIDGYSSMGKILYTTPNFPSLFNFSGKEILNMTIDDIIPNAIQPFHRELIDDAIKYSNLDRIFTVQRDSLIKGKTGGVFHIKLFVKCVPNLSFGLIYIANIIKIHDNDFIIILDKDYKICGFTDMMTQPGLSFTMNNNYGLTHSLYGYHIGLIIPEILLQMEYIDQKFLLPKCEIDLKGNLYPVSVWKELNSKIDIILNKIKQSGKLQPDEEQKKDNIEEYDDLVKEITTKYPKSFSIFYRVVTRCFLDGKYKYHRMYITNDLITIIENTQSNRSIVPSGSNTKKEKQYQYQTKTPEGKESAKQIKIQVEKRMSENKGTNDEEKKDNKKKEEDIKDSNIHISGNQKEEKQKRKGYTKQSSVSSIFTKSSLNSASFNKLKNGILNKQESYSIKIMKYLSLVFGVLSIILLVLNNIRLNQNFKSIDEYLKENLFFNHTKIGVSCVYLTTLNLKWIRDGFIKLNSKCPLSDNWTEFYTNILYECLSDIKFEKEGSAYFYKDFKQILERKKEIELEVYKLAKKDVLTIDIDNLLNLLISNSLKLIANLETYYNNVESKYEINSENILIQSIAYIDDLEAIGFDESQKKIKVKKHFTVTPICLICNCIIFAGLLASFGYLIFKLNFVELFYLEKLIKFHSINFEMYLKRLGDLKKKLRNDTGDDEDKINGDIDINDINSKKTKKESREEDEKDKKKKKIKNELSLKDKAKEQKKTNLKKKGKQKNRQNEIRNEKKNIMSRYFIKYNIFFALKVVLILTIAISYYLVISLTEQSKKNDYLYFDSTTSQIEAVYKTSVDIFLIIKKQLAFYESREYEILLAVDKCNEGIKSVVIGNTTIECPTISITRTFFQDYIYIMDLSKAVNISTPKIGNLLMPLVNDEIGSSEATETIHNLYSADACETLFNNTDTDPRYYNHCCTFWSSILMKGLEQSITQMSVAMNTVIDEVKVLNNIKIASETDFTDLLLIGTAYSKYELFIEFYLLKGYFKTVSLFELIKDAKVNEIVRIFKGILIGYIVTVVTLFGILLYFVYSSKTIFNSFLNFIGILPVKYLYEDDLYNEILKLEQSIF